MEIRAYLNTSEQEIQAKQHNIFVPVSLGNKHFTEELLREEISWAIDNTKDSVVVLIGDKLQAINYEVRSKYSPTRARKVAFRKGEELKQTIEQIVAELPAHKNIKILKWADIETRSHNAMVDTLIKTFEDTTEFRNAILEILQEAIDLSKFTEEEIEKLSYYPLLELPLFVNGFEYNNEVYDVQIYPGRSRIDDLAINIQEGKSFPELTERLQVKTKLKIVESSPD